MAYSSETQLALAVLEELKIELGNEPLFNSDVMALKVKDAIRELKRRREYYNSNMTEDEIVADLENNVSVIKNAARIYYNRIGAEGESVHYENTVHRSFVDDDYIFTGVYPFVKVVL